MTLGITGLAVRPFLSFLHVFLDDMDIGEIQVNGGGEPVVAKDVLNDCQRDTFLKGKGVPEHMGGDALGSPGTIGDPLYKVLYLPGTDEPAIVNGKVMLHQGLQPPGDQLHHLLQRDALNQPAGL